MTRSTLDSLLASTIIDADGAKIGKVKQIFLDNDSGAPTWVSVSTGWFSQDSLVPLAGARPLGEKGDLRVPVRREQVKSAPHLDVDGRLTRDAESKLFAHYGMDPRGGRHAAPVIRPDGDIPLTTGRVRPRMTGDADLLAGGERVIAPRADERADRAGTRTTGAAADALDLTPAVASLEAETETDRPAGRHRKHAEEPDVLW
ncbi:MAG TPA: PRC-barrel domain-containing protein [Nocardia sp.]|uniref:PRC-barrel domain-containing protein n=1 Tax=Nocardia TaxID=1817 RepID=UPI0024562B68|nr:MULTISPECIES: PRC-barrel domain-containing protein [Nocardia]HLS78809.1 PRC-barrel domain-containing protein [Nocardia sp.]